MNEIFGSIVTIIVVWLLDLALPGIHILNIWYLLGVCFVIALVNFFIKPWVDAIAMPLKIITFGIINVFINALMVYITSWILPGFIVDNWWSAVIFALVYYSTMAFLHSFDLEIDS